MEAIGASERVLGYIGDPPAPQLAAGVVPASFSGRFELKDVSFRCDSARYRAAVDGTCIWCYHCR